MIGQKKIIGRFEIEGGGREIFGTSEFVCFVELNTLVIREGGPTKEPSYKEFAVPF